MIIRGLKTFSTELAAGLVLLLFVLSLAAAGTVHYLTRATEEVETAATSHTEDLLRAERLRAEVEHAVSAARGYLISNEGDFLRRMQDAQSRVDEILAGLRRSAASHERELLGELAKAQTRYRRVVDSLIASRATTADFDDPTRFFEREVVPVRRELDRALLALVARSEKRLSAAHALVSREKRDALVAAFAILTMGVLASVVLAIALGRHLAALFRRERTATLNAERAIAARDELLGIVAHDLRNPLSAMLLRVAAIRQTAPEEKIRRQAQLIEADVSRMARLLGSLLDTARIEAGSLSLTRAPFPAQALLLETVEQMSSLADAKSVRLEVGSVPDLMILVDRERALQVLSNIVGNAIKFAPPGTAVEMTPQRSGASIHFQIADCGPGIQAEQLPHIFERFWRGESSGNTGTGLGLYIARTIVEGHGGRIWADSEPGRGTRIHVTFPLSTAERSVAKPTPDELPGHQSAVPA